MPDTIETETLTTRTGFCFTVRAAAPSDEPALAEFFRHVTPRDLRFRFLTGLKTVSHDRLVAMTHIDHLQTENFLAFVDDEAEIIATAMLACNPAMTIGEIAIAIRPEYKAKGVSWDLLAYVAAVAKTKGLKTIQSIESRDNHAAIDMERQMGFTSGPYPGDPSLLLVEKQLNQQ
jgi:N-acetylglutamate synthase-like GNAT family acetyltransferase